MALAHGHGKGASQQGALRGTTTAPAVHAPGRRARLAGHGSGLDRRAISRLRRISDGEYAFYRAHAPVPLAQLVRVAGSRWRIEDGFAAGPSLNNSRAPKRSRERV